MSENAPKRHKGAEMHYFQKFLHIAGKSGQSDDLDALFRKFSGLIGVPEVISAMILEFVQEPRSFVSILNANKLFMDVTIDNKLIARGYLDIRAIHYVNYYGYDLNRKFLKELVKFGRRHEESDICTFCKLDTEQEDISQLMKSYIYSICKSQDLVDTLHYYRDDEEFDPYDTIPPGVGYCSSVLDPKHLHRSRRYLIPFPIVDWRDLKNKYNSGWFNPNTVYPGFYSYDLIDGIYTEISVAEKNSDDDWKAIFEKEIVNCFIRYGNLWWCDNV